MFAVRFMVLGYGVSYGCHVEGEGGVDTLLKSMELGCLGRVTYFKREEPFPILGS